MLALLSGGRLGEPAQESIRDRASLEQIADGAKAIAAARTIARCAADFAAGQVGPGCGDERSAAVGQHRQQQRHTPARQAADDREAAALEGMPPTGHDDRRRKLSAMGSL
jgi:hypothetical protein